MSKSKTTTSPSVDASLCATGRAAMLTAARHLVDVLASSEPITERTALVAALRAAHASTCDVIPCLECSDRGAPVSLSAYRALRATTM